MALTLSNIVQANKTIQWAPGNFSITISLCNSFVPPISISEKKPISIDLHPRDHKLYCHISHTRIC